MMNILLLTIDSLRYDAFKVMPSLYNLAREGISFLNCYSCATSTPAALTSILTGKLPSEHNRLFFMDAGDYETIASVASRNNYQTFAVGINTWLAPDFQHNISTPEPGPSNYKLDRFEAIIKAFDKLYQGQDRTFWFMHTMTLHIPYGMFDQKWGHEGVSLRSKLSDKERKERESAYWHSVELLNSRLGPFLNRLVSEQWMLFCTADHGEMLLDDEDERSFNHSGILHPVVIRVPCFIYGPSIRPETVVDGYQNNVLFALMMQAILDEDIIVPQPPRFIEIYNNEVTTSRGGYIPYI